MKIKFFVNLWPGYDPRLLTAQAYNTGDFSNIPGHKKYMFEVELPGPDELLPVDGSAPSVVAGEVQDDGGEAVGTV